MENLGEKIVGLKGKGGWELRYLLGLGGWAWKDKAIII